jgi:hypothetical protein
VIRVVHALVVVACVSVVDLRWHGGTLGPSPLSQRIVLVRSRRVLFTTVSALVIVDSLMVLLNVIRGRSVGNAWSQVAVGYSFPAPRSGHCMVTVPAVQLPSDARLSQTLTASSYPKLVVFGGINSMYCTSDVWGLRVRRRRSRFYGTLKHHTDAVVAASGADGRRTSDVALEQLDRDVDSGSDGDDWMDERPAGDDEPFNDTVNSGILPWKSGHTARPGAEALESHHGMDVDALRAELFGVRKELIRAREQVAHEVSRRLKVEADRDNAVANVSDLRRELHQLESAAAAERAKLVDEVACVVCGVGFCCSWNGQPLVFVRAV